jgi:hypothetical protein
MLDSVWRVAVAIALALALWSVTWFRVYANKKLRPEFAILVILPALSFHVVQSSGPDYVEAFSTPALQNFNFFLWLAAMWVTIRALMPTPQEYIGRVARDSVFIFMTIITVVYHFSSWASTHTIL